jgi:hypothetical protein
MADSLRRGGRYWLNSIIITAAFGPLLGLSMLALAEGTAAQASVDRVPIDVTNLSDISANGGLPADWHYFSFPSVARKTSYEVVADDRYGSVIRARSAAGAGGVARRISVDPHDYPIITWAWKIEDIIIRSSLAEKSGDDFSARLLISFADRDPAGAVREKTLCYVWTAREPVGSIAINPNHEHVATLVAASGSARAGTWQELSANLEEDYIEAFGVEPGMIQAIALMTDTDDTGVSVRAWYGPIFLSAAAQAVD